MRDAIGSKSTIRNFMGNAGRNTCNDYLYAALQDADEALERFTPMKVIKTDTCSQACPVCNAYDKGYNDGYEIAELTYKNKAKRKGIKL